MKYFKVLVCGGRNLKDANQVHMHLNMIKRDHPDRVVFVIHGGADGADSLADGWARYNRLPSAMVMARWDMGPSAGPVRNAWMMGLQPHMVLAFPGGKGTANMVSQAEKSGIHVQKVL